MPVSVMFTIILTCFCGFGVGLSGMTTENAFTSTLSECIDQEHFKFVLHTFRQTKKKNTFIITASRKENHTKQILIFWFIPYDHQSKAERLFI